MTTTVGFGFTPLSVADVSVGFLDQTKLIMRKDTTNSNGVRFVEYVYNDGDPNRETVVIVRYSVNAQGTVAVAILLRTTQVVTTDSIETEVAPIEVSLNWNMPGPAEDTTVIRSLIGAAFSLSFNGVTSKVPNLGIVNAINRGLVASLYG